MDGFLFVFKQYVFFLFWDLEVGPNIKDLPDQQLKQLCLPEDSMWGISLPDKKMLILDYVALLGSPPSKAEVKAEVKSCKW